MRLSCPVPSAQYMPYMPSLAVPVLPLVYTVCYPGVLTLLLLPGAAPQVQATLQG